MRNSDPISLKKPIGVPHLILDIAPLEPVKCWRAGLSTPSWVGVSTIMRFLQIAFIVVALSSATVLALRDGSRVDSAANAPETQTQWKCRICGDEFKLTAFEVMKQSASPYDGSRGLKCLGCDEEEAYLARTCTTCLGVYFGPEVSGGVGRCPHCSKTNVKAPTPGHSTLESTPAVEEGESERPSPPKPPVKVI